MDFLPDVYIWTDHSGAKDVVSPGYGVSLTAETTSGCISAVERVAEKGTLPEVRPPRVIGGLQPAACCRWGGFQCRVCRRGLCPCLLCDFPAPCLLACVRLRSPTSPLLHAAPPSRCASFVIPGWLSASSLTTASCPHALILVACAPACRPPRASRHSGRQDLGKAAAEMMIMEAAKGGCVDSGMQVGRGAITSTSLRRCVWEAAAAFCANPAVPHGGTPADLPPVVYGPDGRRRFKGSPRAVDICMVRAGGGGGAPPPPPTHTRIHLAVCNPVISTFASVSHAAPPPPPARARSRASTMPAPVIVQ